MRIEYSEPDSSGSRRVTVYDDIGAVMVGVLEPATLILRPPRVHSYGPDKDDVPDWSAIREAKRHVEALAMAEFTERSQEALQRLIEAEKGQKP